MMVDRASDIKTNLASESFCRRFAPRFDERWKLGERLSMVRKNTGWKPMLHFFLDCRAISQSHPGTYRRAPEVTTQRRNVA